MIEVNRYNYKELFDAATAFDASQEAVNALGEWFDTFGQRYWNGEYFDADGRPLYRLYKKVDEDEWETIGYTWSQNESLDSLA